MAPNAVTTVELTLRVEIVDCEDRAEALERIGEALAYFEAPDCNGFDGQAILGALELALDEAGGPPVEPVALRYVGGEG